MSGLIEKIKKVYSIKIAQTNNNECFIYVPENIILGLPKKEVHIYSKRKSIDITLYGIKKTMNCSKEYHNVVVQAILDSNLYRYNMSRKLVRCVDKNKDESDTINFWITEQSIAELELEQSPIYFEAVKKEVEIEKSIID